MALLHFDNVSLEYGEQIILANAAFTLEAGERVCLIGRNGAGKSTILNIITSDVLPDSGKINIPANLRISRLTQALPGELDQNVRDYVRGGLSTLIGWIDRYTGLLEASQEPSVLREMESLQHLIEQAGGWKIDSQIDRIMTELQLPADRKLGELSGGWQRRVALGRALISQPELLLLDEPTNHLDLGAIQWLEDKAFAFTGCILFITHDRAFIQRLATRILELDRGQLRSWPGSYRKYLADKEKLLEDEERMNALFDKRLEQEEAWIRQGIKARRTRNEGRVRALEKMREQYSRRLKREDKASIQIEEGEQSGRKLIELYNVSYGYGDVPLINKFSVKIIRGDRIGLVGNNGVGKSTLLRILLGELQPQGGTVKQGTNLQIAYFDQMRRQLDPERTIVEIIGDGSEYIRIDGKERHVIGYLKGFLFSPKRAMTKIGVLSGGECNRVILAKLFTRPSNLLVLDEPTNDLDVETLEVLEEQLCEYSGTLIVVSHDREFLDNVVTSTLVFEEGGHIQRYAGGYSDWLKQGRMLQEDQSPHAQAARIASAAGNEGMAGNEKPRRQTKLSYKLQLELDGLPDRIEALEQQVAGLQLKSQAADFYNQPYDAVRATLESIEVKEAELEQLMQRWDELENMRSGLQAQ